MRKIILILIFSFVVSQFFIWYKRGIFSLLPCVYISGEWRKVPLWPCPDKYPDCCGITKEILPVWWGTVPETPTTYVLPEAFHPHQLIFANEEGKEAYINFGGDEITYSGDLPVAESAKLFFKVFKDLCPECPQKSH